VIKEIDVHTLAEKLAGGEALYLLDVRQPWEHELASLPNSWLIPLGELLARLQEIDAPTDTLIVVHCHHGIRSLSGVALLEQHGFTNVASLQGGIDAWSRLIDPQTPRY
jgi:rhodanese-related sulfurtransferase